MGIAVGLGIGHGLWHECDTLEKALVVSVIDGDTIELQGDCRVRYLGNDTPELGEYHADEATSRNIELVDGKIVELQSGKRDEDEYGRLLRRRKLFLSLSLRGARFLAYARNRLRNDVGGGACSDTDGCSR